MGKDTKRRGRKVNNHSERIDIALLERGGRVFIFYRIGCAIKSFLFSHGFLVVSFSLVIAFICSSASKARLSDVNKSPLKNNEVKEKKEEAPSYCFSSFIEVSNHIENKDGVVKNERTKPTSKSTGSVVKRNECPAIK